MKQNPWKMTTAVFAGLFALTAAIGVASARRQPLMKDALHDLAIARDTLEAATHDKGGHRVKALELTDQAIAEVKLGIEAGNEH